jgi:hypothetical protein
MLYKFKSKAAGDVIMLGPNGDQLLRLLGREPATQGIFDVAQMPALVAALENAVAVDEAARIDAASQGDDAPRRNGDGVSLRQRAWPLLDMLKRCQAAREPITWGV